MFQASDGEVFKHSVPVHIAAHYVQIIQIRSQEVGSPCLTVSGTAQMENTLMPSWCFVHSSN